MEDTFNDETIMAEDELDLSSDGIVAQEAIFQITDVTKSQLENGIQAVVTFTALDNTVVGFPITDRYWLSHTNPNQKNPSPAQVGRGRLKGLMKAVYGEPSGSLVGLRGLYIGAWLKEGRDGRPALSSFRPVEQETLDSTLAALGLGIG